MSDTLKTVGRTVEVTTDNTMDLISMVDSFYNSAWNKLIIVGSVSFAVIGILIPFVIQWYQKKTLRISEELLKREIENQTLKLRTELLDDINKRLEERVKIFEKRMQELNASTEAKTFHLQANGQLFDNQFTSALVDYITAARNYIACGDYSNLQTVLRIINDNCIPKLSLEEINDIKISSDCDLDKLLDDLWSSDEKGIFGQTIRNIRFGISKLPKTIKDKIPPTSH
jgi:hypothetical protein